MPFFNAQDAPLSKLAECFITKDDKRYTAMFAKNVEVNMNVKTTEVPRLGTTVTGYRATGASIKGKMTIYKCTEIFDDIVEEFKNTGLLPTFELQVTNSDPATSIGRSSKVYNGCIIDGDVLLSLADADGEHIEQEINFYAQDYSSAEKYTNPAYME